MLPGVSDQRVVAVLGVGVVPADSPILRADDLGAVRGDGIFETMHVRDGRAWLLDEHLDRMVRSAARLDLTLPPRAALLELVSQALAPWPISVEGGLRLVCTRGAEDGGDVTVFAMVFPVPAGNLRGRQDGVSVATATLGFPADDVLWVSSDGYALEAPTSTLVWLSGRTLCTVPVGRTGILAGTTGRWLLDHAGELGWDTDERMITPAGLAAADGAWFTSSIRGVAAIRSIDGATLPYSSDLTGRIRTLLGYP